MSLELVADHLLRARRVLVTTHVRPDGDALGTTAAVARALAAKNIDYRVLLLSHLPTKYQFVYERANVNFAALADGETVSPDALDGFDTFLVCDTGTWSQLPGMRPIVERFAGPKLVVDHHLTQEGWADAKHVDTSAAAAGELAADLLRQLGVPLDAATADALYVALVSDTGWFQFSNTSPRTLRLAAELLEAGADADGLYQRLYQNERAERLMLQRLAMGTLRFAGAGRVAVMTVTRTMFAEAGAATTDTEALVNVPLQVGACAVSVLVTEPPEGGATRVSLRSKGGVDCARFAEQFGGGGHARAAGLKLDGPAGEVAERVVGALKTALPPLSS